MADFAMKITFLEIFTVNYSIRFCLLNKLLLSVGVWYNSNTVIAVLDYLAFYFCYCLIIKYNKNKACFFFVFLLLCFRGCTVLLFFQHLEIYPAYSHDRYKNEPYLLFLWPNWKGILSVYCDIMKITYSDIIY